MRGMAYARGTEMDGSEALARSTCLSNETIGRFCESASAGQAGAMAGTIEDELAVRSRRKRERLPGKAKLPAVKTFEGCDFSQVAFPDGCGAEDLMSLAFVAEAQDFVFHGKTGRGKTRLAIAIGLACVERGMEARFLAAAELVMALTRARREHRLEALLADLSRADLLIVDELGYVPLDVEGARLLFQAMSGCYERRSLVVTTNIESGRWGTVFGDDKLAAALIDRIVHHGRLVESDGTSHRMDTALMLGKAE